MTTKKRTLTTTQAAKIKGWSSSTMLRAAEAGKFRAFRTPGGHWRIDPAALEAAGPGADVLAEREACALAALAYVKGSANPTTRYVGKMIAYAIRHRE